MVPSLLLNSGVLNELVATALLIVLKRMIIDREQTARRMIETTDETDVKAVSNMI